MFIPLSALLLWVCVCVCVLYYASSLHIFIAACFHSAVVTVINERQLVCFEIPFHRAKLINYTLRVSRANINMHIAPLEICNLQHKFYEICNLLEIVLWWPEPMTVQNNHDIDIMQLLF